MVFNIHREMANDYNTHYCDSKTLKSMLGRVDNVTLFITIKEQFTLNPVLGGVDSVAPFITANEQSE